VGSASQVKDKIAGGVGEHELLVVASLFNPCDSSKGVQLKRSGRLGLEKLVWKKKSRRGGGRVGCKGDYLNGAGQREQPIERSGGGRGTPDVKGLLYGSLSGTL